MSNWIFNSLASSRTVITFSLSIILSFGSALGATGGTAFFMLFLLLFGKRSMFVADSGIPLENLILMSSFKTDGSFYFCYFYFLFKGGLIPPLVDRSKEISSFCSGSLVVIRLSRSKFCLLLVVNPLLKLLPSSLLS